MPEIDHGPFAFGQLIRAYYDRTQTIYVEGRIVEEYALLNGRIPACVVMPDRIVRDGREELFFPGGVVCVPYHVPDDFEGRIEFVMSQAYVWGLLTTLIAQTEGEEAALAVMGEDDSLDDDDASDDFLDGCDDMNWHLESVARAQEAMLRMMPWLRPDER